MNELLERAVAAHGGHEAWQGVRAVAARLRIGGAIWAFKGRPEMFDHVEFHADYDRQRVRMVSRSSDWQSDFTPERVRIETRAGRLRGEVAAPRGRFDGHKQASAWDEFHALYFCSYALWNYLAQPFLYARPGFALETLPAWTENGERWERLKATFPDGLDTHSREQILYFGDDGLLRRHDYTVEVMGGATGANYASNYRDCGGIVVPMSRRVYAYDAAGQKQDEPLLVSIDIESIEFTRA